jgi:signal transduction histidine kinase
VEILNRSPEELVGESFDSIIGSLINIAQIGDNNGRYSFETSVEINGSIKCLNINCKSNFNREEKFVGAFGSIRDITEQKKLQEVTEYNKIKTEFFANMSHELRTPINVILAAIQLLESYNKDILDDENARISRYIRTMKQNSYRLVRLINNLIDITKAEAGFLDIHLKNQNIVSIVEDITLSIVEYTNSKGINLQFDTDFEEMITACDADKIERIMLNFLSNAIKHTARGGKILVTITQRDENAVISIKDNGVGIPKDKLKLIFERFVQVDKSLNRLNEGSGIGLSITKSLVELHGGNISAFSIPGEGSEFVFTIPIKSIVEDNGLDDRRNDSSILEKINIEFSDIYS